MLEDKEFFYKVQKVNMFISFHSVGIRTVFWCLWLCFCAQFASAADQASVDYSSSYSSNVSSSSNSTGAMWGTATGGMVTTSGNWAIGGTVDSATMHQMNGMSAGYVESAQKGLLYARGTSITIQSVGAQNIVNSTIYGNSNNVEIQAEQISKNTGAITTSGTISTLPPSTPPL